MNKKFSIGLTLSIAMLAMAVVAVPRASAFSLSSMMPWANGNASAPKVNATVRVGGRMGQQPGIFGTVTAVNGTTLTVSSRGFGRGEWATTTPTTTPTAPKTAPAPVIYTVDASGATVMKNNATSTISAIAVNDMVRVTGTVNGTNVTATKISDGVVPGMNGGRGVGMPRTGAPVGAGGRPGMFASSTIAQLQGNGQPIVGGTVSAINGNSLTITNSGSATYTVDVTNAKITRPGVTTATVANITVNDHVLVQGTVNGTAITATSVIDQPAPATTSTATTTPPAPRGILGSIGLFFSHLFGF